MAVERSVQSYNNVKNNNNNDNNNNNNEFTNCINLVHPTRLEMFYPKYIYLYIIFIIIFPFTDNHHFFN